MEYTKGKWEADIRVGVATVHVKDDMKYNCLDGMRSQCIYYATGEQVLNEDGSLKEWTISPEAVANAHLIAQSPRMAEWIIKVAKQNFVTFPEDRAEAKEIIQTLDLS